MGKRAADWASINTSARKGYTTKTATNSLTLLRPVVNGSRHPVVGRLGRIDLSSLCDIDLNLRYWFFGDV